MYFQITAGDDTQEYSVQLPQGDNDPETGVLRDLLQVILSGGG